jgi:hypothetical protein
MPWVAREATGWRARLRRRLRDWRYDHSQSLTSAAIGAACAAAMIIGMRLAGLLG